MKTLLWPSVDVYATAESCGSPPPPPAPEIDPDAFALNDSQRKAATFDGGHALVLAGAGCGKTKTIIARCEHLIAHAVPSDRICVLAFTRRAAAEIVARVSTAHLGPRAQGLHASTFHSFCMSLIHQHPQWFGCAGWSVIDREEQIDLITVLRHRRNGLPRAAYLADIYSFARNTLCDLTKAISTYDENHDVRNPCLPRAAEIASIFRQYEDRKRKRHYLDYDDVLDVVATQLQTRPEIRNAASRRYSHIIVDEFQDVNALQWKLLGNFTASASLFCVGDDAQSIYGFRGADFRMIHSFAERVPGAAILRLECNYRSTQEILDLSNWLLQQSPLNYGKKLQASRGPGQKPRLLNFLTEWDEGAWIAHDLLARQRNGAQWREHMILLRSAGSARAVETCLLENKIPYRFIGGTQLFAAAHIRDVISVLRIVANPHDELGWVRYLKLWPSIGEATATDITALVLEKDSLADALSCLASHKNVAAAGDCRALLERCAKESSTPRNALRIAFRGLEPLLAKRYTEQWDRRKNDFTIVEKLADQHTTISGFIAEYILNPVYGAELYPSLAFDAVTLITVHSAKGTEANVCYVIDASPGSWPHKRALSGRTPEAVNDKVEEERRVLYVALTRAKNELILTRTQRRVYAHSSVTLERDTYFLDGLPPDLVIEEAAAILPRQSVEDNDEGARNTDAPPMPHVGIFMAQDP